MKQDLRITYRMIRPGETAEARITLSMLTDTAESLLAGHRHEYVDAILTLAAALQGYDKGEICYCEPRGKVYYLPQMSRGQR